jgi:hypothetical protein
MRASAEERLVCFLRLVDLAEEVYPYVSADRLRALARSDPEWTPVVGLIGKLLRQAHAAGLLLSDARTRLSRSGRFSPLRIYRLNRRHPRVAELLEEIE